MSYNDSLQRLHEIQKRSGQAVTKVTKPPFGTFVTNPQAHSEKTDNPFGAFGTAPPGHFRKIAPSPERAPRDRETLALRMGEAAEGLPVTVEELLEAYGEEGMADWLDGYVPHSSNEYLRCFAEAISERLARERDFQTRAEGAVTKVTKLPELDPDPLAGLALLSGDRRSIERRTINRRDGEVLLIEYAQRWRAAADQEPSEHRKANAGGQAANSWLRKDVR